MYGSKHNIIKMNEIFDVLMIQEFRLLGFILNANICEVYHAGVKYAKNNKEIIKVIKAT